MALTRTQQAELERRLNELHRNILEKIRATAPRPADEKTLDRAGATLDEGDEAASSAEEDFNHALHERYLGELRQVETARERLAGADNGRCADCGDDIDYERLRAYPLAVRCIACQDRYERAVGLSRAALR